MDREGHRSPAKAQASWGAPDSLGQPAPYNAFPFIALALVAAAAVIGFLVVHRHPRAGAGEGAEVPGT